jgi:hypothetical protein
VALKVSILLDCAVDDFAYVASSLKSDPDLALSKYFNILALTLEVTIVSNTECNIHQAFEIGREIAHYTSNI